MYNNRNLIIGNNTVGARQKGFSDNYEPSLISELFYYGKPIVKYFSLPVWAASDSIYPLMGDIKDKMNSYIPEGSSNKYRPHWAKYVEGDNYLTVDGRWVFDWNKVSDRKGVWSFCLPPGGEYTGKGVLVSAYNLDHEKVTQTQIWPEKLYQYPAGDYPAKFLSLGADSQLQKLIPMQTLMVPAKWKVRIVDEAKNEKPYIDIQGPAVVQGRNILTNISQYSMQVRGPWMLSDYQNSVQLGKQMTGWITRNWPQKPVKEDLDALILMDPQRKNTSSFNEALPGYKSLWGPGWENQINKMVNVFKAISREA